MREFFSRYWWAVLLAVAVPYGWLTYSWPATGIYLGCLLVWVALRWSEKAVAKAFSYVAGPACLGVALVLALEYILARLGNGADLVALTVENTIVSYALMTKAISSVVSVGWFFLALCLAGIYSYRYPGSKALDRFEKARKPIKALWIVLLTASGFTFLGQPGFGSIQARAEERLQARFNLALVQTERGQIEQAVYESATEVIEGQSPTTEADTDLDGFDPALDRTVLKQALLDGLRSSTVPHITLTAVREAVLDAMTQAHAMPAVFEQIHVRTSPSLITPPAPPRPGATTLAEWQAQRAQVVLAESIAAEAQVAASESRSFLKQAISKLIGEAIPEENQFFKTWLHKLLDGVLEGPIKKADLLMRRGVKAALQRSLLGSIKTEMEIRRTFVVVRQALLVHSDPQLASDELKRLRARVPTVTRRGEYIRLRRRAQLERRQRMAFDRANDLLLQERYQEAKRSFQTFVRRYPRSSFVADAQSKLNQIDRLVVRGEEGFGTVRVTNQTLVFARVVLTGPRMVIFNLSPSGFDSKGVPAGTYTASLTSGSLSIPDWETVVVVPGETASLVVIPTSSPRSFGR